MHPRFRRRKAAASAAAFALVLTGALGGLAFSASASADETGTAGHAGHTVTGGSASGASALAGENPDWGQALPPEGAEHSRAYEIITEGDKYDPREGECSKEIHARYWAYGPDEKVYPTWHPTEDPSGCYFGHEHGDDPRDAGPVYDTYGWPTFGYTSEVMAVSLPEGSHRHEDHVGHKIVAGTGIAAIQGDDGSSLFPPQGGTVATCDLMIKYHQGTHSPDAFTNNMHEVLLDQQCRRDGQTFETSYKAMVPFGNPGEFATHDCPGPFLSRTIDAGTAVPGDSIPDTGSIGRLITAEDCAQAIRDGKTRFDPISGGQVPLDSDQLHEFWFGTGAIAGAGVDFRFSPLLYSLRPSRYYDPSRPDNLARQIDLCDDPQIVGEPCELVRQRGGDIAWDSPDSPFNGALRDIRIGAFTQQAGGSTTIYTDAYGRNASTEPFEGSIEQFFSGNSGDGIYLRAALKDWTAPGVHAPN